MNEPLPQGSDDMWDTSHEITPAPAMPPTLFDASPEVCPQCGQPMVHECWNCKSAHKSGRKPTDGKR